MVSDPDPLHDDLLAIHSRLGAIEGKVNLLARVDRLQFLQLLRETIEKQPLIGQIYLALDGVRTQNEIVDFLAEFKIETSAPTVSRRLGEMEREHGMVDLIKGGNSKVYGQDPTSEKILNLAANIRKWLVAGGQAIPEKQKKRTRRKK
jgi:DNA-binding transcriptional ArsR family regulator